MQDLNNIIKSGKLRIGVNIQKGVDSAPWIWNDEQTKNIMGFEAEIAKRLTQCLNIEPQFISANSYRLIINLLNGQYDIVISAIKPDNIISGLAFSTPYYYLTQRLITLQNNKIQDLTHFKGKTLGILSNSIGEFIIESTNIQTKTPIKTKSYDDITHLFSDLHFYEIDGIFIDSPIALWYSKTSINKTITVSNIAYKCGCYSIAIKQENTQLLKCLNQLLQEISIKEILEKYGLWDDTQKELIKNNNIAYLYSN